MAAAQKMPIRKPIQSPLVGQLRPPEEGYDLVGGGLHMVDGVAVHVHLRAVAHGVGHGEKLLAVCTDEPEVLLVGHAAPEVDFASVQDLNAGHLGMAVRHGGGVFPEGEGAVGLAAPVDDDRIQGNNDAAVQTVDLALVDERTLRLPGDEDLVIVQIPHPGGGDAIDGRKDHHQQHQRDQEDLRESFKLTESVHKTHLLCCFHYIRFFQSVQ